MTWRPGRRYREGFDHLVLATGAIPVRPPLPGCDAAGVFGVQTLDDGEALLAGLERLRPRHAVVIGGGYIGVEMAEALARRQVAVTVVDQAPQPMSTLDPDMGELVHQAMEQLGIDVHTDTAVTGFDTDGDGQVRSVATTDGAVQADAVVLGLGVRPNTALADRPGCRWATTAASAPTCRCGCSATTSCGRAGTVWRSSTWSPASTSTCPWAPTPTSTAG